MSFPFALFRRTGPPRDEFGVVALVNQELAMQFVVFPHGPPAPRQRRAVSAIASRPRELHRWLTASMGRAMIDVPLDVAELEGALALVFELDERLDLFIEVFVVPDRHRHDAPATLEWIGPFRLLRHASLLAPLPIRGYVRNQPLAEGNLLQVPGCVANINHQPIYLQEPDQWIVAHLARQGPVRVKLTDLQRLSDKGQFRRSSALTDAEMSIDFAQAHIRLLGLVLEKVDPANRADDPTCPGVRATSCKRRWTFAGQLLGEFAAKHNVLVVQMFFAELVSHADDDPKDFGDIFLRWRLRHASGSRRFHGQWRLRHRERRDNTLTCLGLIVALVQHTSDAAAERDVVTGQQAVIND